MTPTQQLASIRLGKPVLDWIAEQRAAGTTWDRMAQNLETLTGIDISREAIRQWHNDAKKDAA